MKGRSNVKLGALLALGLLFPILNPTIASAQLFRGQYRNRPTTFNTQLNTQPPIIRTGTVIPVRYDKAEKIVLAKDETMDLTVLVSANLKDRTGRILIPYGSQIVGQIKPIGQNQGSQFVASQLVLTNGKQLPISALSQVITRTETIKKGSDTGDILQGALIGAGAALVISAITGDRAIATEEILGGAGLGALGGWILGGSSSEVISINPNTDLNVTLQSDLTISQ